MRILIVEDDLEAAEAMDRGLTEAGNACTRAPDGEAGQRSAGKCRHAAHHAGAIRPFAIEFWVWHGVAPCR